MYEKVFLILLKVAGTELGRGKWAGVTIQLRAIK